MTKVGDRVEVKSKSGARTGKVTGVSGELLRVLWDTGEETSIVPAAGVLSVLPGRVPSKTAPVEAPTSTAPKAKAKKAKAKKAKKGGKKP